MPSWICCLLCLLLTSPSTLTRAESAETVVKGASPHVFISVLVTNSRHALSNFFGYLEGLDYPKDRITVWYVYTTVRMRICIVAAFCSRVRTDHNVDDTATAVSIWCYKVKSLYKSVDCHASNDWIYPTVQPYSQSVQRSKNKARLRQQALETARTAGADYMVVGLFTPNVSAHCNVSISTDSGCGLLFSQFQDYSATNGAKQVNHLHNRYWASGSYRFASPDTVNVSTRFYLGVRRSKRNFFYIIDSALYSKGNTRELQLIQKCTPINILLIIIMETRREVIHNT